MKRRAYQATTDIRLPKGEKLRFEEHGTCAEIANAAKTAALQAWMRIGSQRVIDEGRWADDGGAVSA